jgi:predicted Abi (CAAX) family protease
MLRMRAIERWHFNDSVLTFSKTFKGLEHSCLMEQQSHDNKQLLAQTPGDVQCPAGGDPRDSPLGT